MGISGNLANVNYMLYLVSLCISHVVNVPGCDPHDTHDVICDVMCDVIYDVICDIITSFVMIIKQNLKPWTRTSHLGDGCNLENGLQFGERITFVSRIKTSVICV